MPENRLKRTRDAYKDPSPKVDHIVPSEICKSYHEKQWHYEPLKKRWYCPVCKSYLTRLLE